MDPMRLASRFLRTVAAAINAAVRGAGLTRGRGVGFIGVRRWWWWRRRRCVIRGRGVGLTKGVGFIRGRGVGTIRRGV